VRRRGLFRQLKMTRLWYECRNLKKAHGATAGRNGSVGGSKEIPQTRGNAFEQEAGRAYSEHPVALDRSSLKILAKIAVKACETALAGIRMLGECYGSAAGGPGPFSSDLVDFPGTERRPLPNDPGGRNASSSSTDGTTMIGKHRVRR
jgi:hypothetical protein